MKQGDVRPLRGVGHPLLAPARRRAATGLPTPRCPAAAAAPPAAAEAAKTAAASAPAAAEASAKSAPDSAAAAPATSQTALDTQQPQQAADRESAYPPQHGRPPRAEYHPRCEGGSNACQRRRQPEQEGPQQQEERPVL